MLRRFIGMTWAWLPRAAAPTSLERGSGPHDPSGLADGSEYQVEQEVIGRIDLAPDGSYVQYDYKTGSALQQQRCVWEKMCKLPPTC